MDCLTAKRLRLLAVHLQFVHNNNNKRMSVQDGEGNTENIVAVAIILV